MNLKRIINLFILLVLIAVSGCSIKKNKQKSEVKTEIKEVISTIYTDTGKIITIREIEYRTIYDTLTKTFTQVKWKVREKITENKAITEAKAENKVITQTKKESSKEASKEPKPFNFVVRLFLWVFILGTIILLVLHLKKKYLP